MTRQVVPGTSTLATSVTDPAAVGQVTVRLLPLGATGVLIDGGDQPTRRRLVAAIEAAAIAEVVEVVPAAVTVALRVAEPSQVAGLVERLRSVIVPTLQAPGVASTRVSSATPASPAAPVVVCPVVYDGPDVAEVCAAWSITRAELVAWHTGQQWTCDFTGFLPGFGYLVADHPRWVARRATPRTRIPAGAVGLASDYCGIYPSASPGGWQVIGRTDLALFDPARTPAALLGAGTRVRFEQAR